jgi:hypothetical protein
MKPDALPRFAVSGVAYSQWAYWCSLAVAALSVIYVPPGSVRTAIILVPILPGLLCVSVAYWLYQACDEYLQFRLLRCVAITAVAVTFCTLGYFLLELLGFPHLSMLWVNLLGWSAFNLQMLFVVFRSR